MKSFELNDQQHNRFRSWFDHHWSVVHRGWRPPDMSGFAVWIMFGPTGCGENVKAKCVWCDVECDLTEDDDGEFIISYDENWIKT